MTNTTEQLSLSRAERDAQMLIGSLQELYSATMNPSMLAMTEILLEQANQMKYRLSLMSQPVE